ncbi:hypothetical protein [Salinibacter altiplanensis]|uniref:hypothetical protein n=1 Tax=Salinibacter altiplanensis TaxID=1803181 RepID=UPI001E4CC849|nr:hypothetical protein [Salinibacter altiplanensis]
MPSSFPVHGAHPHDDAVTFRVWAPAADAVALELKDGPSLALSATEGGLFVRTTDAAAPGTRYRFRLDDDGPFPDPASRHQPEGVHGPSEVVDPTAYDWGDADWTGVAREDLVVYELHVGAFTEAGTFDAVREQLTYLRDLGITAIELMPVHGFPGARNWGYDPAAWFAPARTYGRPGALGRSRQPGRRGRRGGAALLRRQRAALAARVPHRRPPPRRHSCPARRE